MSQFGNIEIQASELRTLASDIRQQQARLESEMASIRNQMNNLGNQGWRSQSGDNIRQRFDTLRGNYDRRFPPAFEEYINFLNRSADDYEAAERQRKADVERLATDIR